MKSLFAYCKEHMRWKPFLWLHAFAIFIFASWFIQPTSNLWKELDRELFHYLNGTLEASPIAQIFWALANVKITDLFGAVFMVGFSLLFVFDKGSTIAPFRLAQFFYFLLWFEIGIFSLKEILFKVLLACDYLRDSPSLIFQNTFLLSEVVPWLKIKDSSHWSFPGDHAFIVLQWAGFISVFCGYRLGILAYLSSLFFILPRLIAGAHWITDTFCGSLPLSIISIAWACYTPLYPFFMTYFERMSQRLFSVITSIRNFKMVRLNVQKES